MTERKKFTLEFSLSREIAGILRDRILHGEYGIGEQLKENRIAGELRVSRTPVREAFKILEDEGLVEYRKNRGCFAQGITRQDLEDIYAVRKALEGLAVEWACRHMTPDYVQRLTDHCDLMDFYAGREDALQVLELNEGFHDIIYEAAGSRFMARVLRSYKGYIRMNRRNVFYEEKNLREISAEHKAIRDALAAGDEKAARQAMSRHLDESRRRAEASLARME